MTRRTGAPARAVVPPPWSALRRRLAVLAAGIAGASACGATPQSATAPPPSRGSSEQQSTSEYDLARDAFQAGRLRDALGHVRKAIEFNGDNADAHYLGAVVLLNFCALDERSTDCRYNEAEAEARKALDAQADLRDAKNTLGVILIHEKRYDDAIAVLKPLANDMLYGSPEKSWGNLGWAYLERGQVDEAIDALQRAVAAQPLFCVGNYRLGLAFAAKGDAKAAREALTRALDTPQPACKGLQDAFFERGKIEQKLGLADDARRDLAHCRDLNAQTPVGVRCGSLLQSSP
ncbi:MAG TPA: tetratricopeptide repeat protein [Byssovorax sp.]